MTTDLLELTELDVATEEIDGVTELHDLTISPEELWTELVVYASCLLNAYEKIFSLDPNASTESQNDVAYQLLPVLCENLWRSSYLRSYNERGHYSDFPLPDVCSVCYRSFALTISGRYRIGCPSCCYKGPRTRRARLVAEAMHRVSMYGELNRGLLSQLVYKYYSPNGDPKWKLVNLLTVEEKNAGEQT